MDRLSGVSSVAGISFSMIPGIQRTSFADRGTTLAEFPHQLGESITQARGGD
jgi:hypothetical protein